MTLQYRCDQCAEVAEAADAVGWVEVRPLGGRPFLPPEPTHLCRLCWARTTAAASPGSYEGEQPQVSEHTQNRDTLQ